MSRSIRLIRSSRKESYGFEFKTLSLDGKHVAFNIIPGSIAEKAGLKNGDYILEVNDESVSGLWHDAVLMKMSIYSRRLDLLVANDLITFIKDRRGSYINEILKEETSETNEFTSFVSNRTNLSNKKPMTKKLENIENHFNDRSSIATSKSYRDQRGNKSSQNNTLRLSTSSELLNDLKKVTSTPKLKTKISTPIKTPIVFESESNYPSLNLTNVKAKLEEFGKNIKLEPNGLSNEKSLYGFNFRTSKEGQHVITNIIPDYPAHEAGIQDGDYILEVNGEIITSLSHNQVIKKIFSNPNHVELLIVTDLDAYLNARQVFSQVKEGKMSDQDSNRYYIKKSSYTKLGLNVISNGIIASVDAYSPAEKAGLRKGLKIIKINDISLKDKTDHQIKKMIKDNENYMVIDAIRVYDTINLNSIQLDDLSDFEFVPPLGNQTTALNQSSVSASSRKNKPNGFDTSLDSTTTEEKFEQDSHSEKTDYSIKKTNNMNSRIMDRKISAGNSHNDQIYSNGELKNQRKNNHIYENPNIKHNDEDNDEEVDNLIGSRLITLIPRPDYEGFGFELTYDNKNNGPAQIKNVKLDSPAYTAGLRENDLVLKINDDDVVRELYSKIVNMLRNARDKGPVKLEVIDANIYNLTLRKQQRRLELNGEREETFTTQQIIKANKKSDTRFKRCYLKLLPEWDGFGLTVSPDMKPKFSIFEVEPNSPAYKANLRKTDVIVEIDRINIRQYKFKDFFRLMQNGLQNQQIEICAINLNGYYYYKDKGKRFSSKSLVNSENTDLYST